MSRRETVGTGDTTEDPLVTRFREWLEEKAANHEDEYRPEHAWSRVGENQKYADTMDVDRWHVRNTEAFTTVLVTRCAARGPDESIYEHAESFTGRSLSRKRRDVLKDVGVYDDFAGVEVLAPKMVDKRPATHVHEAYWFPGEVPRDPFEEYLEYYKAGPGTKVENPPDKAVKVQHHTAAEVETPEDVRDRGTDLTKERGHTTALPLEVGNNLPLLGVKPDVRDTPEYVFQWAAGLSLGSDGDPTTPGVSRFKRLGRFKELAERVRSGRE